MVIGSRPQSAMTGQIGVEENVVMQGDVKID